MTAQIIYNFPNQIKFPFPSNYPASSAEATVLGLSASLNNAANPNEGFPFPVLNGAIPPGLWNNFESLILEGVSAFTGATSSSTGYQGLVPAPAPGQQFYFLEGDGVWSNNLRLIANTGSVSANSGTFSHGVNVLSATGGYQIGGVNFLTDNGSTTSVFVGYQAGLNNSSVRSVAVGSNAANNGQQSDSVAIGYNAAFNNQQSNCVAIGSLAGETFQQAGSVAIGYSAGQFTQGFSCVAIGTNTGQFSQGIAGVAIGVGCGNNFQADQAVAIGTSAGFSTQNNNAVAIGVQPGYFNQGTNSVAIGTSAGQYTQGAQSISIGFGAGQTGQGLNSIAIGTNAGQTGQGNLSISIGNNAGVFTQQAYSIAIGNQAFQNVGCTGSICLNALGTNLDAQNTGSLYIAPIRSLAASATMNVLCYSGTTSREIFVNTSKTFVINNPIDPETYLVHGCLEGPEAGVYYRGRGEVSNNISTNVFLPAYASKVASDFTVNITPINGANLSVSEIENNMFTVYGQGKFHWVVFGTREHIKVTPRKDAVEVCGDGPYTYIQPRQRKHPDRGAPR